MPLGIVNDTATDAKSSCIHEFAFILLRTGAVSSRNIIFFSLFVPAKFYNGLTTQEFYKARSLALRALLFCVQSQRPEDEAPRRRHESEPAPCRQNQAEPEVKPASGEDEESGSWGGNHGRRGRYQPSRGRLRGREGE